MFLVLCNEAFGYTHERTLDSDLALVMSMLREHGYLVNETNHCSWTMINPGIIMASGSR